jgi:hypothetical protein
MDDHYTSQRRREIINSIYPTVRKGNGAWKRIERLQAEDGDFNAGTDIGFEPRKH